MQVLIEQNRNFFRLGLLSDQYEEIKSSLNITYKDIAEALSTSYDAVRMAFKRGSFTELQLDRIEQKFGINRTWLMTGSGDMMKEKKSSYVKAPQNPSAVKESESKYNAVIQMDGGFMMHVPFVHKYAYAGYLSGFGDPEYLEELPTIPWVVDNPPKGNYITLEVKGDSMDDGSIYSYPDGCQVLCRELQRQHWVNKLHIDQWDFVIVHRDDGILLKRIISHDVENGNITLKSLNDLYEDFTVSLNDVEQIFNVVQKVLKSKR